MGVIYKLKDEVVHFILGQRQGNPLFSCRQLAESASEKFGLHLSKSSVHDVLKESGIVTPRGRKPKFKIPQEKKIQIQESFSKVKLLAPMQSKEESVTSEYAQAGRIFLKAALWDLGIFSEANIKETDWKYYLTYSKGVQVVLENNKILFIELVLPLERCIREVVDGLINNIKPFIADKVSDQEIFKACMNAQEMFKINSIAIVERSNNILLELNNIMEQNRRFLLTNRVFVENYYNDPLERAMAIFFSQTTEDKDFIYKLLNLNGFDTASKNELTVNLIIDSNFSNKTILQEAVEKLNGMYIYDEQGRLLKVKTNSPELP